MWANVLGGLVGVALALFLVAWMLRLLSRLGTTVSSPQALPPPGRSRPFGALPGLGGVNTLGRLQPAADLELASASDLLGPGT